MGSQGGRVTKQDAIEAALRAILTNEHGLLEVEALRIAPDLENLANTCERLGVEKAREAVETAEKSSFEIAEVGLEIALEAIDALKGDV
ncbi:hypothetical protein LCGC14_0831610 [marine sediment metagenome]|uniref:Uncharacterized protein n=1 Tax=marine sediment metagenome TaxID=412755 RepID=A0A0F9Q0X7_9ZZZZ